MLDIIDVSTDTETAYQLRIDGQRRVLLTRRKSGEIKMNWQVCGPIGIDESKQLIQGLLELYIIADQLTGESQNACLPRQTKKNMPAG